MLDEPGLTLPHPRAAERLFVMGPLAEIAPGWRHPVDGRDGARTWPPRRDVGADATPLPQEGPRAEALASALHIAAAKPYVDRFQSRSPEDSMARVTVEDCVEKVPNRFSLVLLAAHRARAISAGAPLLVDRDNDKNPVVALREIADDVVDAEDLRENLIATLQRVDERTEAEEEAETLALLADPQHMQMSEQELVRALQSDRDGGQEERY